MNIRRAQTSDIDAILELERVCFAAPGERFQRRQVRGLQANPRAVVLVLVQRQEVLGWAAGLLRRQRRRRSGRLYALAVHPRMHGRRLGLALARRVCAQLRRGGAERIYLEVRADNHPAIHLYHGLGFVDRGALPDYYGPAVPGRSMVWAALPI